MSKKNRCWIKKDVREFGPVKIKCIGSAAKCAYSTVILRIYCGFHHGLRHLATNYGERHAFSAMHNLSF